MFGLKKDFSFVFYYRSACKVMQRCSFVFRVVILDQWYKFKIDASNIWGIAKESSVKTVAFGYKP